MKQKKNYVLDFQLNEDGRMQKTMELFCSLLFFSHPTKPHLFILYEMILKFYKLEVRKMERNYLIVFNFILIFIY